MIKKSIICGITVAALTYEPTIATTGGAFVGMVDETNPEMVQGVCDCLQGTLKTFPLEKAAAMIPSALTSQMKPMIFITPEAMKILSADELMFILQHEQGHIEFDHLNQMIEDGVGLTTKTEEMGIRHEIEADTYGFNHCGLSGQECINTLKKMLKIAIIAANAMSECTGSEEPIPTITDEESDEFVNDLFVNNDHFAKRAANLLSLVR